MKELYTALVNLQAELKPVDKSASNPFFKSKYAPLPEVMATIQPLLAEHKLAVMQLMDNLNGEPALTTIVAHESGEEIRSTSPLLLAKNDPQSHGSAVTYARRYGLMAALGLVADEDDDGNKASVAVKKTVTNGADAELLSRAKYKINKALEEAGYDNSVAKSMFINRVIKKHVIDTEREANLVMDAIENEKVTA